MRRALSISSLVPADVRGLKTDSEDVQHTSPSSDTSVGTVTTWVLLTILLAGAAVRILTIDFRGLWIDEVTTVWQAQMPIGQLVELFISGKLYHPPLFHISMHYWIRLFGIGEVALRLFAAMFGVGSIVAAFWAAKALDGRRAGLIASGIVAFSPYLIWYSQDARMYSMSMFFGFMSTGYFLRALLNNRRGDWVGYGVMTALGMFSHYTFLFLPLGQAVYYLWLELFIPLRQRQRGDNAGTLWTRLLRIRQDVPTLGPWLATVGLYSAVFAIWFAPAVLMPAAATGLNSAAASTLAPRFADSVRIIVEMIGGFHSPSVISGAVAMWPLMISALLIGLDFSNYFRRRAALFITAGVGIVLVVSWGQWNPIMMSSRYLIALVAPLVLLVAGTVAMLPRRRATVVLLLGFVLSAALWTNQTFSLANDMRDGSRESIAHVAENYQTGDTVIYQPWFLQSLYEYYLPADMEAYPIPMLDDDEKPRRGSDELTADLNRVVGQAPRVWLVMGYEDMPEHAEISSFTLAWLRSKGYSPQDEQRVGGTRLLLLQEGRTGALDNGSSE